jgi:hypothetical protein
MSDTPRTDAKHMSPDKAVCKTCNDTGFIVSRSPTTGDEQRYQCNHDGTIFVPLPAASQNLWVCKARRSSGPEPQDCGWPSCGCDPFIDKTIRRLNECGLYVVPGEPTKEMIDAATEATPDTGWPIPGYTPFVPSESFYKDAYVAMVKRSQEP